MKRSESLARLHAAAKLKAIGQDAVEFWDAMNHGLAAVRAIRACEEHSCPCGTLGFYYDVVRPPAVSEARRAVRAALRAVGIQGAL